jgi:hypothetical protein
MAKKEMGWPDCGSSSASLKKKGGVDGGCWPENKGPARVVSDRRGDDSEIV